MQPAAMREYHSRSSANCLKLTLKKAFSWIIFNSVKLVLGLEIWTVQLFKIEQNGDKNIFNLRDRGCLNKNLIKKIIVFGLPLRKLVKMILFLSTVIMQ